MIMMEHHEKLDLQDANQHQPTAQVIKGDVITSLKPCWSHELLGKAGVPTLIGSADGFGWFPDTCAQSYIYIHIHR